MTASLFFAVACFAAVVGAAAHFIVRREPPGEDFPTARFVPAGPSIVRMLTHAPTDRWLLAARMAAILLIGLAFAPPHLPHHRVPRVAIVAIDRSGAVRDEQEAIDSARASLESVGAADPHGAAVPILILFDSTTTVITGSPTTDSLNRLRRSDVSGSLTAAMIAAVRVAAQWQARADSIALTVVSPVRGDELDAALEPVRALWPGDVHLVRIAARSNTAQPGGNLPVIDWPADGHIAHGVPRTQVDTVGAVEIGDVVVVRQLERRWRPDTVGTRIIGRWVDGEPAAVERGTPNGCTREIAVATDTASGVHRDPALAHLLRALKEPCNAPTGRPFRVSPIGVWRPTTGQLQIPARAFMATSPESNRLSIVLLGLALTVLALESLLRARARRVYVA